MVSPIGEGAERGASKVPEGAGRGIPDGAGREAPERVDAARRRAAVELFARHESTLRRTAGRYSICADDAEEALQRGLEILLRKAPSEDQRELIRWMQTVVKHEALAVRAERERILSGPPAPAPAEGEDWVALLPAAEPGPAERAERQEAVARSREALQALKPQELRALGLLAEGYSYAEIGRITGYSKTKVNRCLAEGRERFRRLLASGEDGRRCAEMRPLLSAFCDGEASAGEEARLREHLRACVGCRATLRAYRAAPRAVAALLPALPASRTLLERAHQALAELATRFGVGGGDGGATQVAVAGGSRGAGAAALAKLLAVCAGTAGGAAVCVASGVAPAPLGLGQHEQPPTIERRLPARAASAWSARSEAAETEAAVVEGGESEPAAGTEEPAASEPRSESKPPPELREAAPASVEYAPAPEATPAPAPVAATPIAAPTSGGGGAPSGSGASGSAAGEFGP